MKNKFIFSLGILICVLALNVTTSYAQSESPSPNPSASPSPSESPSVSPQATSSPVESSPSSSAKEEVLGKAQVLGATGISDMSVWILAGAVGIIVLFGGWAIARSHHEEE